MTKMRGRAKPPPTGLTLALSLGTCAECGAPSNTAFCAGCLPCERKEWPNRREESIAWGMLIQANPEMRGLHRRLHPIRQGET